MLSLYELTTILQAKFVHLIDTFFACEVWALALGGRDGKDKKESKHFHLELAEQN